MKITGFLMLIAALQAQARVTAQDITISLHDAPLTTVFHEITRQTGYDFVYSNQVITESRPVTVNMKKVSLQQALTRCLAGQPLRFSIIDSTVVVNYDPLSLQGSPALPVDTQLVSGTVTDQGDQPLAGVTVRLKGTGTGTVTDIHGNFAIAVPGAGQVLVFSFIGYRKTEITLKNQAEGLNIKLSPVFQKLLRVTISTGYQTIAKERSAGAFAKPDMDIVEDRSSSMNILQRLDGLVAGLTINNAPSAAENPFLIRGLSTIGIPDPNDPSRYTGTNRNPLYVVDGIPIDNVSSVNPRDVADITVLKDATAASIWGARASNGVIIITTKRGRADKKLQVQYDGFVNFQGRPNLHYFPAMNSKQFIRTAEEIFDPVLYPWSTESAFTNLGSTGLAPHEVIMYNRYRGLISQAQADKSLDSLASINNVSQIRDLWYRNAMLMHHTLSLSGGGEKYAFYGSLGYTDTRSDRPGDRDDAYNINVRQDFTFNKHIRAYLITNLNTRVTSAKRPINIDNRFYPYQLFKDQAGNNLSMPYMGYLSDSVRLDFQSRSRISLDYNPLDEFNYGYTKGNSISGRVTGGITVNLFKGLHFEGVYGYIRGAEKTTDYDDEKSYPVRTEVVEFTVAPTPSSTPVYYLPDQGGKYTINNWNQRNWTVRNQLVYDNSWHDRLHQLTLLAGQEAQEQLVVTNGSTVRGYNEKLQTFAALDYATLRTTGVAGTVMPNGSGKSTLSNDVFRKTETQTRFTSYYANAAYTYNEKYTLNASWRIDQSNLFGIDKSAQNRPVWSVGAKWMMSREAFMKAPDWLNSLGLRATYGITGNSPLPGTASSFDISKAVSSGFLPGGVGLTIATPANRKLTWESTRTVNIGIDFALLDYRLNGSIDLYNKKTTNLLGQLPTNTFTGYASIIGNFGDLQNKGLEITIHSLNISNKDFRWSTLLTMAYNKNTITKLNLAAPITTGDQKVSQQYLTGYPAFAVFAFDYAGLDTLGDPMVYLSDKTATKAPHVTKPEDVHYMGTYQPVWSGGLSNIFKFKNFGLSINAIYNLGYVMRRDVGPFYYTAKSYSGMPGHVNVLSGSINSGFTGGNFNKEFLNRWKKRGDEKFTNIPSYVSSSALSESRRETDYYRKGDLNVISASYIKLRDIMLSYSLPKSLISRIKTDDITLRVQVSNLMLWKANQYGIDPEFQDAFYGVRSLRSGQGTVTIGAHVTF